MYDGNCLAILPSKYQEIGCSLSFEKRQTAKSAMELRAPTTFYSSISLSIKRQLSLTPNITEAQRPGPPTLHSPPETLSVRGRDLIAALANDH